MTHPPADDANSAASADSADAPSDSKKTNSKKTSARTKKTAAKKTAKKSATTKKTAAKKTTKAASKTTTKKAAAKKTTKKTTASTTKKAATKKTSKKSDPESEAPQETLEQETVEQENLDQDAVEESADQDQEETEAEARPRRSRRKAASKREPRRDSKRDAKAAPKSKPIVPGDMEMVVNSIPGADCRIAITEDGKLEEFFSEHAAHASRVGNIYTARVTNIEPSIQAAFVDFGGEENAFLHITDLHPTYFSKNEDKTEKVGKKTPHRQRPPIQEALKRGQEITVQILKEGVGTKGPSVTSYLSIPGRFIVMMPGMDNIGVSRKEEDDDKRRAAKKILSELELPEGFGFILRTAGFNRTKTELKRDLAYLKRLWSDIERRQKGSKPKLLYTESDLLLRTIRDLLTSDYKRVVIDSESALKRVANFIKIAAPRSHVELAKYTGSAPIFHAFDIERQIEEIHAREVPLPSGGALVIDQTEALVAIDVNSGKSRGARDAESNAVHTNMEAADAICRQLRLRDMGGLVVCDMIDMRHSSNRKKVENQFNERLKRDRAKSTTAPISPFGLLELTRQRMRGSMESQHFADCPTCRGRGLVQRPGSVADSALRELAAVMDHPKVQRIELVVNPRVASELLSTRRSAMVRTELTAKKNVEVRVSDSLPLDRFSLYAYEPNGNDLDTDKLIKQYNPKPTTERYEHPDADDWAVEAEDGDSKTMLEIAEEFARRAEEEERAALENGFEDDDADNAEDRPKKKRRRRGRRRSERAEGDAEASEDTKPTRSRTTRDSNDDTEDDAEPQQRDPESEQSDDDDDAPKKKRRRRGRRGGRNRRKKTDADDTTDQDSDSAAEDASDREQDRDEDAPKPRRSRKKTSTRAAKDPDKADAKDDKPKPDAEAKPKPRRRGLYAGARRKLSASEVASADRDS